MIYLVGGPPRCGKTTLAEELAKKHSIPYFSVDHLGSLISPYIPSAQQADAFPLAAARAKAGGGNDAFHAIHSPVEIADLYLRQAQTFWPGLQNFIRYALSDEHDLVLEGWQLLPRLLGTFHTHEQRERLAVIFLYKLDPAKIVAGLKSGANDWVVRHTKEEKTFAAIAEMIACFGRYIESEAASHVFRAVNTESEFAQRLADAEAWLASR